jgi:hypothetical protein
MTELALPIVRIPAMTTQAVAKVREFEHELAQMPQAEIHTDHLIHGGMYVRTIKIPAGVALTGAFIKRPTTLVVTGDVVLYTGDEALHLVGHHVIPASAGRKQAFMANADTWLTMAFPTSATTIEAAECEFTDDAHLLMSRARPDLNRITITGE